MGRDAGKSRRRGYVWGCYKRVGRGLLAEANKRSFRGRRAETPGFPGGETASFGGVSRCCRIVVGRRLFGGLVALGVDGRSGFFVCVGCVVRCR